MLKQLDFNPRLPHVQITELSAIPVDLKTGDLGDPFVRNIKLNSETLKKMEHEKEKSCCPKIKSNVSCRCIKVSIIRY